MRQTAITIPWADSEDPGYTFNLPLKQVEQLEEETGFGVAMLLHRLQTGQHKSREPRLTILYGLIGGGMDAAKARQMVKAWVDDRPGKERDEPAQAILLAWLMGVPQEKKAPAPETEIETTTAPAGSTSANSTQPVPH